MKRILTALLFSLILSVAALSQVTTPPPYDKLKVGDMAPDFTLPDLSGKSVKLSEFRGKHNVVLAFYVFAFTGG